MDKNALWLVVLLAAMVWTAVLGQAGTPSAPNIPGLSVERSWPGLCPREAPLPKDLNGDGVEDYIVPSFHRGQFKEYLPPEAGAQMGLIGALLSMKASTGNKNFCFSGAVDGATGKPLWEFKAGALVNAHGLTQDGSRLFLASHDNHLYGLETASGKELWRLDLGGNIVGLALGESAVVAATTRNRAVGVDPTTGKTLWEKSLPIPLMVEGWGYLLDEGPRVFVVSMDDKIHCLDKLTGQEAWVYPTSGNPSLRILSKGTLVVADSGALVGVNTQTGQKAWNFNPGGKPYIEPIVDIGGTLVGFNGRRGSSAGLFAIDAVTGQVRWTLALQKIPYDRNRSIIVPEDGNYFRSSLAVGSSEGGAPSRLYLADRKKLLAVAMDTGKEAWSVPMKEAQLVFRAGGKVYAQDKSKKLYCCREDSGEVLWTYEAQSLARSLASCGPVLIAVCHNETGFALDVGSGKELRAFSSGEPAWLIPWGEERLLLSGGGQTWVLKGTPPLS